MVVETFRMVLSRGDFDIIMRAKEISAAELMKFYSVILTPLKTFENNASTAEYSQTNLGD